MDSPPSKSVIFFETYTFKFRNLYGVFGAVLNDGPVWFLILSINSVQFSFSEENGNIIFVSFLVHK